MDVDDWLGSESISVMPLLAEGAYFRLLCYQWRNGSVPADIRPLARLVKLSDDEFNSIWEYLEPNFPVAGDRRCNPRLASERESREGVSKKRAEAGRNGGIAKQVASKSEAIAKQMPSDLEQEQYLNLDRKLEPDQESKTEVIFLDTNTLRESEGGETGKPSRSQAFWSMLPESHQTPELLEAIKIYFQMRSQKKQKPWVPATLDQRSKEFAKYQPDVCVYALNQSVSHGWDGVFLDRAQKEVAKGAASKQSSETPDEKVARLMAGVKELRENAG
jgi:uncharacterized protein YdaU (DUF1376 family)